MTDKSANETASTDHNGNENGNGDEAAMVTPSPSVLDTSSSSTKSPFVSIFDTPKMPAAQKKKRHADRSIGNIDAIDVNAKRVTRSKAKGDAAGLFIHFNCEYSSFFLIESTLMLKMCSNFFVFAQMMAQAHA